MTTLVTTAVTPQDGALPLDRSGTGIDLYGNWLAKGRAADRVLDRRLRFTISAAILGLLFWVAVVF